MNRRDARIAVGQAVLANVLGFVAPPVVLLMALVPPATSGGWALREGRRGFWVFTLITVVLDALLLAWSSPGTGPAVRIGPIAFGLDGALDGAWGGLRIVAVVAANMVWLQSTRVAAVIEGLHLPRRTTVFLAALLIAVEDIGRDFRRLMDGLRMTGDWPTGRLRQADAVAGLIPPLLVASVGRARVRRDALRLAGIPTPPRFVPLVALTALALAGRFALVAVPNVSLVHVVVFVGGVVFGPLVGVGAAVLAMGISDLFLSGLLPTAFVNVPAMAMVGLLGGVLGRVDFSRRAGKATAAALGVVATLLFSVTADVGEWLLVPEFRGDLAFLQVRVAAGLLFNAVPALVNGFLFALVCGPVQQAFGRIRPRRPDLARSPPSPTPATDRP